MKAQLQAIACHDIVVAVILERDPTLAAAMKELEQNFNGYAFVIDCNSNKIDLIYDFCEAQAERHVGRRCRAGRRPAGCRWPAAPIASR